MSKKRLSPLGRIIMNSLIDSKEFSLIHTCYEMVSLFFLVTQIDALGLIDDDLLELILARYTDSHDLSILHYKGILS